MKKLLPVVLTVLWIVALAAGCACSGTATPTPTPTVKPTETPVTATMEPVPSQQPDVSPDTSGAPNASALPDAGATIPNFQENTEVKAEDVPEIKKAVEEKYPNAAIKSIKHALKDNQQLYAVEITTGGTTETVYVLPNGTMYEATTPNP